MVSVGVVLCMATSPLATLFYVVDCFQVSSFVKDVSLKLDILKDADQLVLDVDF